MRPFRSFLFGFSLTASLVASACSGDDDASDTPQSVDPNANEPAPSTVCRTALAIRPASPVADARARAATSVAIDLSDDGGMRGQRPVKVVLAKDGAPIATLFDGARELGAFDVTLEPDVTADLATGRYSVDATSGCPTGATSETPGSATTPIFLVRLGVTSLDVTRGDGERAPLMYHAVDHRYDNLYPISQAVAATLAIPDGEPEIDGPDGKLRTFAKPWADLGSPPVAPDGTVIEGGVTLPVSLRIGTKPDLAFHIGKSATGKAGPQTTGLEQQGIPPIRIVVDGVPPSDAATITPGKDVIVRLASSPVPSIKRADTSIRWHFEAKSANEAWKPIAGADGAATIRIYGVLGNTQGTTAPNLPWVAVVDEATRVIAGEATDAAKARAILVRHIYEEMGLTYDRVAGASHYSNYLGGFGGGATFKLARFLARDLGAVVNCSDCASILSAYANMIGAELKYAIIESDFSLNPILGIGASQFGSPFNNGRMGFSYHAVTSADATTTIYDATLAIDGDADPTQAPFTKLLVQGVPGPEYLQRLSGDSNAEYTHVSKTSLLGF